MKRRIVVAVVLAVLMAASAHAQTTDFLELVKTGTPQSVQDAITKGANTKARDSMGRGPLLVAASNNPNPEVITILLKAGEDINGLDGEGNNCLVWAARNNLEVITTLLKAGADVETREPLYDANALMWAASDNPDPKVITALLNAGSDIKSCNRDNVTTLMWAAMRNKNAEVIVTLLNAGAEVNAQDSGGRTALTWAAKSNPNPGVITTLLDAGSNIEVLDFMGHTPLMIAAETNPSPEVIISLLKAGVDAKAKDNAGKTAFDYAKSNYSLRVRGANVLKQLEEASK
ncbi:MAG: ankyrin repeat domain-containing protein [Spirochaetia bacterium]|jgi:ankyrin repeat protein